MFLSGTVYETAHSSVDDLRKEGINIGIAQVRFLRPFFDKELKELVKGKRKLIIIDRNYSFGNGGVFANEIKSALFGENIEVQSVIAGLGGRDITVNTIKEIVYKSFKDENFPEYWEGEVYE